MFISLTNVVELMPDRPIMEEAIDEVDVALEFIIPGLPSLSKKINVGAIDFGTSPTGNLEKDLALYEKKTRDYMAKLVGEARSSERPEIIVPDPLKFWLAQVYISSSKTLLLM